MEAAASSSALRRAVVAVGVLACLAASFVAVRTLPSLDRALDLTSGEPGPVTLVGTGLALAALTALSLYLVMVLGLRWGWRVFVLALVYNLLIVLVKFGLGTRNVYVVNRERFWSGGFGTWQGAGLVIFLLYAGVFTVLGAIYRRRAKRAILAGPGAPAPAWPSAVRTALATALLTGLSVAIIVFVLANADTKASEYLQFALRGGYGVAIALALAAAIGFASAAFDSLARQAVAVRSSALVTSFVVIGVAMIAVYHALWVAYILLVVAIWPLKAVSTK